MEPDESELCADDLVVGAEKLIHVVNARPVGEYLLDLTFDDEERTRKIVDVEPILRKGGVFRHLLDPRLFRRVTVRDGTVFWDFDHGRGYVDGIDIDPESLYDLEAVDS